MLRRLQHSIKVNLIFAAAKVHRLAASCSDRCQKIHMGQMDRTFFFFISVPANYLGVESWFDGVSDEAC